MTFQDSILTCLKKYADFKGRASRSEYWWFLLAFVLLYVVAVIIDPTSMIAMIVALASLLPSLAVGVRRLHDIDKSGWFVLLSLIPLVGLIMIYFYCQRGTPGPNRFGPEPAAN